MRTYRCSFGPERSSCSLRPGRPTRSRETRSTSDTRSTLQRKKEQERDWHTWKVNYPSQWSEIHNCWFDWILLGSVYIRRYWWYWWTDINSALKLKRVLNIKFIDVIGSSKWVRAAHGTDWIWLSTFFFFCFIGWPSSVKTVESSVWWSDTNCSYTDNAVTFCILKENCSHTNYMFQISSEPGHTRKTSPAHLMFDSYLEKYVSVQLGGRQILVLNLQLILWIQGYHQYQGFPAEEKRQNKSVHCSDCNLPVY